MWWARVATIGERNTERAEEFEAAMRAARTPRQRLRLYWLAERHWRNACTAHAVVLDMCIAE